MSVKSVDVAKILVVANAHRCARLVLVFHNRLLRENLTVEDAARAFVDADSKGAVSDAKEITQHQRELNDYFRRLKKQVALIHKEKK